MKLVTKTPLSSFSVYSGYLVLVGLLTKFLFQTLGLHLAASQRCERWQRKHEVEIIIRCNAVKAFQSAIEAAMDEDILALTALEAADGFHTSPTGAHAISRSLVIDMTREKAKRTVIPVMRATSRWA